MRAVGFGFNRVLKKLSYRLRSDRSWAYPSVFQIEATNFCNLRCPMCPYDTMTRDVGYMEIDLFRRVVDQLAGCTRVLRLHNMGESLFHKQIDEMIRYARSKGVTTAISTNATALNEKAAERILTAQLDQLFISFDGAHKETYEMYRKGARFERSLANVLHFLEIKEQRQAVKPHTTLSMIEMAGTEGEIGEFRDFWQKRVDAVRIKRVKNWDGSVDRINEIALKDFRPLDAPPCSWLWDRMVVLWDGRVVPCCYDYDGKYVLGNLRDRTLKQIFNDQPMRELRKLHAAGRAHESSLCQGCAQLHTRI